MGIPFICVGDKTSGGGVVITGSPTDIINGKMMARIGDKATCTVKNHPRTVTIVTSSDNSVITSGSPQAFHGDKLSCGCTLISSQVATNSDPRTSPPEVMTFANSTPTAIPSYNEQQPASPVNESENWIKFKLDDEGNCDGLSCIAHFDDGSKMSGTFDSNNLVSFSNVTGSKVNRLELGTSNQKQEYSVTEMLLNILKG
jgi:uncharacterized Zn-binding protein involved in type VI secretion